MMRAAPQARIVAALRTGIVPRGGAFAQREIHDIAHVDMIGSICR